MAEGRTISGCMRGSMPSSVSRRAAFSVVSSLRKVPRRVAQRRRHRVPAIHDDRAVGLAAQGVAAGALEALAALDLLAGRAGFGAGVNGGIGVPLRLALTEIRCRAEQPALT